MSERVSPSELLGRLRARDGEMALLDVRPEDAFAEGHILLASSLPLTQLDSGIARLVPRQMTRIILCDDYDGLARTAQERLTALGFRNIALLEGGMPAWVKEGYEVFSGVNVPGKVLGLFAQHSLSIPELSPGEYAQLDEDGRRFLLIDCRPFEEYRQGAIPAAQNSSGFETVHEMRAIEGGTHVVLSCAGRTRGLIAAQTLRDFGFRGNVSALRGGTMGWEISGRAIRRNASRKWKPQFAAEPPSDESVNRLIAKAGIHVLDADSWVRWMSDGNRTLYLFDVRQRAEYDEGRIPGACSVPGAQLIHALDTHVATLGARIVLSDDDGIRAAATALWLRRMGWRDVGLLSLSVVAEREREDGGLRYDIMPAKPSPTAGLKQDAMHAYLARSDDLLEKVTRDGTLPLAAIAVH